MRIGKTNREIKETECNWLDSTVPCGVEVILVSDPYGCCSPEGVFVQISDRSVHTEIPVDAITWA